MEFGEQNLSILFFPMVDQGHMLPMLDMAKLFATRGVSVTVLAIPESATLIRRTIDRFKSSVSSPIKLHIFSLPSAVEESENTSSATPKFVNFLKIVPLLMEPFDNLLEDMQPDCVVSDYFLPWTYEMAAKHGIPRISFDGCNFFARCVSNIIDQNQLLESLPPEAKTLVIPGLPHHIEMLRSQIQDLSKIILSKNPLIENLKHAIEVNSKNYGTVVNSFYELEPDYVEHCRKVLGYKVWHVGPVALCNKEEVDKSERGGGSREGEECLKWLDGRMSRSVVYLCFGSGSEFTIPQLREMALGLEASNHPFVWVVRNEGDEWIPQGFKQRIEGKGLIIKGWVPQLLILNHAAVGSFVTHCGWNSSLEGISVGLPMGTWPIYADQFFNERFLVDVLKIGVAMGSKVNDLRPEERPVVEAKSLEMAVRRLMGEGEEAEERRRRAMELKEMARKAVEEGGSSYNDIGNLMRDLMERKANL